MAEKKYPVPIHGTPCDACGDPATKFLGGRPLCHECFAELRHGVIGPPPRNLDTAYRPPKATHD
jgi:hypothetical protein